MASSLPSPEDPHTRRLERPVGRRAVILSSLVMLAGFVAWLAAPWLGVVAGVRGLFVASVPLIALVGYQVWGIRILADAVGTSGRKLATVIGRLLGRGRPNEGRPALRPTPAEVRDLNLRALEHARAFVTVANGFAIVTGVIAGFAITWLAALCIAAALMAWGRSLAALGRAGWLPIPEGD